MSLEQELNTIVKNCLDISVNYHSKIIFKSTEFKEHPVVPGHRIYVPTRYARDISDHDDLYNCTLENAVAKLYTFFLLLRVNTKERYSLKYAGLAIDPTEYRSHADGFACIGYVLMALLLSSVFTIASSDSPTDGLLFSPASAVL